MPAQWRGTLKLSGGKGQPVIQIQLFFTGSAEGRWTAEVMYFSSFDTRGIEQSRLQSTSRNEDAITNALVRRLRDFVHYQNGAHRFAPMDQDELSALLQSVSTGAWRHAASKSVCPKDQDSNERKDPVCYLSGNSQGCTLLSPDAARHPVPWGVTTLPIVLNHRYDQDHAIEGCIDSGVALHYGGNPRFELGFSGDSADCPNADDAPEGAACLGQVGELVPRSWSPGATAAPNSSAPVAEPHFKTTEQRVDAYDDQPVLTVHDTTDILISKALYVAGMGCASSNSTCGVLTAFAWLCSRRVCATRLAYSAGFCGAADLRAAWTLRLPRTPRTALRRSTTNRTIGTGHRGGRAALQSRARLRCHHPIGWPFVPRNHSGSGSKCRLRLVINREQWLRGRGAGA